MWCGDIVRNLTPENTDANEMKRGDWAVSQTSFCLCKPLSDCALLMTVSQKENLTSTLAREVWHLIESGSVNFPVTDFKLPNLEPLDFEEVVSMIGSAIQSFGALLFVLLLFCLNASSFEQNLNSSELGSLSIEGRQLPAGQCSKTEACADASCCNYIS